MMIGFCLYAAVSPVFAKPISDVLKSGEQTFDPWNQQRWADWYKDGQIVKSFDIDCSVTFAPRKDPWVFSLEKFAEVNGHASAVFRVNAKTAVVIDGNNVTLDARREKYRNWSIQDFHAKPIVLDDVTTKVYGFRFLQQENEDSASVLKDITLIGFWRAVETSHHSHARPVVWENIKALRNNCAFYPTGTRGVIRNCEISESLAIGIYADQASHDWIIEKNTFRDNNVAGKRSWAAITLDACYDYTIRDNVFLTPSATPKDYFCAIAFYRNQGERDDIREYPASWNRIERNQFEGFNIALDLGVRMGMKPSKILKNLAQEGRCYVSYNLVQENTFKNCRIGVLMRTGFNKIDNNTFENTAIPIALHNAFYALPHNIIVNQPDVKVALWSQKPEFESYANLVAFHDGLGSNIPASEKLYHIIAPQGAPSFSDPGEATLVVGDSLVGMPKKETPLDYNTFPIAPEAAHAKGFDNKPVDMAVGKFTQGRPSSDFAVIFDQPSSQVDEDKYYSIYLFDQNGNEFDRCGRSTKRWSKIAAGNFLADKGEYIEDLNDQIAAVSSEPDERGCYPVYIFRKGIAKPAATLLKDNKTPVAGLAGGNFHTGGDGYDEIAVLLESSGVIHLAKPSDPTWTSVIHTGNSDLTAIVAGEFDGNDGHEIAAIAKSPSRISLFKAGEDKPYAFSGPTAAWKRIAVGKFGDGDDEQLAVAQSGEDGFSIHFFESGKEEAFHVMTSPLPGGLPIGIAGAQYAKPDSETAGDSLLGGLRPEASHHIVAELAILPETAPISIPVLAWIPVHPGDKTEAPSQIVPILK